LRWWSRGRPGERVVVVAESVSSLDPVVGLRALQTVQDEALRRGATLVVSLHDVSLARARFGRLIGLRDGKVLFDLSNEQVTDDWLAELYGAEPSGSTLDDLTSAPHGARISRCF